MLIYTVCINKDTRRHFSVLSDGSKKLCVRLLILSICISRALEVYSALAYTVFINKTQDTILVSCQMDQKNCAYAYTCIFAQEVYSALSYCYTVCIKKTQEVHCVHINAQAVQNLACNVLILLKFPTQVDFTWAQLRAL